MNNTDLIKILTDGPFETNEKKMHWTECFNILNFFCTALSKQ